MAKMKGPSLTFFYQTMGDGRVKFGISTDKVLAVNFWAQNSKDPMACAVKQVIDLRFHGDLPKDKMRAQDAVQFLSEKLELMEEILSDFIFANKNGIAPDSMGELINTASPFKIFAWGTDAAARKALCTHARALRTELKTCLRKLGGKKAGVIASKLVTHMTKAQKQAIKALKKGKKKPQTVRA